MPGTFVMIKPDAVEAGQVGSIIARFERKGYSIDGMLVNPCVSLGLIATHYIEHRDKAFYGSLCNSIVKRKVVVLCVSHPLYEEQHSELVQAVRALVGAVDKPGTIRGDFGKSFSSNAVHASDSVDAAKRELALWGL